MIGFSNNPALCIAKWFTSSFGMNLPWVSLDQDSVIAAANTCDERVLIQSRSATVSADVTADRFTYTSEHRILDWGDGVRLTTSGTLPGGLSVGVTYYVIPSEDGAIQLATSPANALAGTAIDLATVGSGTHTLISYDEARYKLNGSYKADVGKGQVLVQLLSAMAGFAVHIGGKWYLHAGAAAVPTVTLTENDLRGPMEYVPKRSMRDRFNGVRCVYMNPSANWQPVDAPPLLNETYLAEDDGEELFEDLRLPFTTSTPAAQRLMKITLERNRRQGVVQFPAKLTAMRLQPWDGVYLTISRYGWTQKQFRVVGWVLSDDGAGIDLTLQEDDANVYAWSPDEETDAAEQQGVISPNPSSISPPTQITVTTPTLAYTRLEAIASEVLSIWLDGYDFEYRDVGTTDWTSYGRVDKEEGTDPRISVERTTPQDFRVRAVTQSGTSSAFTENLAPAALTGVTATGAPNEIEIEWTGGEAQLWTNPTNDPESATLLYTGDSPYLHTGLVGAETHHYWLRAVNASGNISALAHVSATALM